MSDQGECETPMSDHVDRFWRYLAEGKVRIMVDMFRPDSFGGTGHWDSASFQDDAAKAVLSDHRKAVKALESIALLDEADGRELTAGHALKAVAIATSTLGRHPSEIFAALKGNI